MNCIAAFQRARPGWLPPTLFCPTAGLLALLLAAASACAASAASTPTDPDRIYDVEYVIAPDLTAGGLWVELRLKQPRLLLRSFNMRRGRIVGNSVSADGDVQVSDDRIVWTPPTRGGTLRWFLPVNHVRSNERYDAFMNSDWSIFRASDAMPSASTRTLKGSLSRTHLRFELPDDWSSLTPYFGRDDRYSIDNPDRRFDRPTGWFLLGNIGRRNETIVGRRVVVAGPAGQAVRRMDALALMRWTLPELTRLLPDFPPRVTVIAAGEPMWRGGLSAPNSIFIHADRPLISENGTSTLLHELMHVGIGLSGTEGADWIVEGLAEYYSLELLRRSGTISAKRFDTALGDLEEWGTRARSLCVRRASGAVTARAVTVLAGLDRELRRSSATDLDEVLRELVTSNRDISLAGLQSVVAKLAGTLPGTITDENLPGCGS